MSNRILSYKGLLAHGAQETILLSTKKGEVGYRVIKFKLMVSEPGQQTSEHVVKIYKESQSTIDNTTDFSDNRLLGMAWLGFGATTGPTNLLIDIFDQEIFNQDIFITCDDASGNAKPCNYYLELEAIKLDESQAMVATLKDIRNNS